jgi:hypothetical protein
MVQSSDLSKLRTAALRWGLEDSAQVSALDPGCNLVDEFSLVAGHEHELPQELQHLFAEQLRKAAKIVHVRFD